MSCCSHPSPSPNAPPPGLCAPEAYLPIALSLTHPGESCSCPIPVLWVAHRRHPAPVLWQPLPLPGAKGAGALEAPPQPPQLCSSQQVPPTTEAHLPVFWERPGPCQPAGGSPFLCLLLAIRVFGPSFNTLDSQCIIYFTACFSFNHSMHQACMLGTIAGAMDKMVAKQIIFALLGFKL